jgi:hypothetical protein
MVCIATYSGCSNGDELFEKHFGRALAVVLEDIGRWDKTSPNLYTLESLVIQGAVAASKREQMEQLLPILRRLADPREQPDVRLRIMSILNNLLAKAGKSMS